MARLSLPSLDADADAFASKHALPDEAAAELRALLARQASVPLFGESHVEQLQQMWGIDASFSLPLTPDVAASADGGVPLVVSQPTSDAAATYTQLATAVAREVRALGTRPRPQLMYLSESNQVAIITPDGGSQAISPVALRRLCRSPSNVPEAVPDDVTPLDIVPMGNYAVSVQWSDGHQSLLPYASFVEGWSSDS